MKSTGYRFLAFLLAVFALLAFAACGKTTTEAVTTTGRPSLVGEYEIDITNLGMPLVVYLRISEDDTFQLSPDRTFTVDKGHGTIGSMGDTYMFLYSDSTTETPKTSTFHLDGRNLLFATALPYGSSNLHYEVVDEENPEIVYHLYAMIIMYESQLGVYAGSHTVEAMGGSVEYDYTLSLKSGCQYAFQSTFETGGEEYVYDESGVFAVDGSTLSLTPEEGETVTGTINQDGSLDVAIKPSEMAARESRHLRVATTNAYAGTYLGMTAEGSLGVVVALDRFGGYQVSVGEPEGTPWTETGTFAVSGTAITLQPSEGASRTGTLSGYVLTVEWPDAADGSGSASVKGYHDYVNGIFTGTTTVEEVDYEGVVVLAADGTYTVAITPAAGGDAVLEQSGTFTVGGFPLSVNLKFGAVTTKCVISSSGLNVNFVVGEVTYGFILKK